MCHQTQQPEALGYIFSKFAKLVQKVDPVSHVLAKTAVGKTAVGRILVPSAINTTPKKITAPSAVPVAAQVVQEPAPTPASTTVPAPASTGILSSLSDTNKKYLMYGGGGLLLLGIIYVATRKKKKTAALNGPAKPKRKARKKR